MILLTGKGSFADEYTKQFKTEIASIRDLGEPGFLEKISKADVIIHNAATVESSELELSVERNFDFTRFIIKHLEKTNPTAHLILLSSMSILDPNDSYSYGSVLDMTPYAYSKYLAETFSLKCNLEHVSCVRFSTLFFQDPAKDGLSKLVTDAKHDGAITIYNNGEALRNFLPLDVAVQYIEKIARRTKPEKRTFTLAAEDPTSFMSVAQILKAELPKLEIRDKALPNTGRAVLANFHQDDIKELGLIDFSLEKKIIAYLKAL